MQLYPEKKQHSKATWLFVFIIAVNGLSRVVLQYNTLSDTPINTYMLHCISCLRIATDFIVPGLLIIFSAYQLKYDRFKFRYLLKLLGGMFIAIVITFSYYFKNEFALMQMESLKELNSSNEKIYISKEKYTIEIENQLKEIELIHNETLTLLENRVKSSHQMIYLWSVYILFILVLAFFIPKNRIITELVDDSN